MGVRGGRWRGGARGVETILEVELELKEPDEPAAPRNSYKLVSWSLLQRELRSGLGLDWFTDVMDNPYELVLLVLVCACCGVIWANLYLGIIVNHW